MRVALVPHENDQARSSLVATSASMHLLRRNLLESVRKTDRSHHDQQAARSRTATYVREFLPISTGQRSEILVKLQLLQSPDKASESDRSRGTILA